MAGNVSGFRVGPKTTVSFWQNTLYQGRTKNTSEQDFFNLCNPSAQPDGAWNDKPRSLKITVGPFTGTVNNNPGTNVSTSLAVGPSSGCVWIYIHCSVEESRAKKGVYNFCETEIHDLSTQSVENITNFDYIFGPVGNRSLMGNVSGSIIGPDTGLTIYDDVNLKGKDISIFESNKFINYCDNGWNDKPKSFSVNSLEGFPLPPDAEY